MGPLSGDPGRRPGATSTTAYSSSAGTTRRASSTRSASPPSGHIEGEAPLLDGGPEHEAAVVTGDQVARPSVHEGAHGAAQAGAPRRARPAGRSPPAPVGPAAASASGSPASAPDRLPAATTTAPADRGPPVLEDHAEHPAAVHLHPHHPVGHEVDPGGPAGLRERGGHGAIVDLVVGGQVDPAADAGGQERLGLPARPCPEPAAGSPMATWKACTRSVAARSDGPPATTRVPSAR